MSERDITRVYREATPEELARHQQIRQQIQQEIPEMRHRACEMLAAQPDLKWLSRFGFDTAGNCPSLLNRRSP
ncbi:MAG: hypothetical protein R2911_00540 [Caldilineaceae bacterium]